MPGVGFHLDGVVEPGYAGDWLGLNAALEDKPLAIVFLPDGWLARERWRFTVHLSGNC